MTLRTCSFPLGYKSSSTGGIAASAVLIAIALATGCMAPPQNFPIGGALWNQANPEYSGIASGVGSGPSDALASALGAALAHHLVLVGVLDGGTDYNHPRLRAHIHPFTTPAASGRTYGVGYDTLGADYFPSPRILATDAKTSETQDISHDLGMDEHGTHVAQLVTLGDARIGLIPVRVLPLGDTSGAAPGLSTDRLLGLATGMSEEMATLAIRTMDSIAQGIDFAAAHGASVINMSVGMDIGDIKPPYMEKVLAHLDTALVQRMRTDWKSVLMVVAAGNERTPMSRITESLPATLPVEDNILSVGALAPGKNADRVPGDRLIAFYSNYGAYVDIYVRGSEIKSAVPPTADPSGWQKLSGTSMAAPIAAHLVAQLKAIAPSLTGPELRALVLTTADLAVLPFEAEPDGVNLHAPVVPSKLAVRVLNPVRARQIARRLAQLSDSERRRWLTAPYAHGNAPQVTGTTP